MGKSNVKMDTDGKNGTKKRTNNGKIMGKSAIIWCIMGI